jgi:MFS family permease
MSLPVFFPIMAIDYGVPGSLIGLVIAMPAIIAILTTPLVNHYIQTIGIEESVLYSMLLFGISNCIMSIAIFCPPNQSFMWVSCISSLLFGLSAAGITVGESALLLRYSRKEDRETNLGMFRAATGLGGLISPLLGAGLYYFGGFFLVFLVNGIGCLVISPFVFCGMKESRIQFLKLQKHEED